MSKMRVEVLTENFPYEDITELLHASYKEHLDAGRNYLAATQTVEDTKRRLEGKMCALCYDENDRLVGSIAGKLVKKEPGAQRKWYEDDSFIYIDQMAVRPECRKDNILAIMTLKLMRNKLVRSVDSWMSDTSVKADGLVKAYVGLGFQIVDLVSWDTTNYYSYVFRKPINGKQYSEKFVKFKFFLAQLKCKLQFSEDGKKRF